MDKTAKTILTVLLLAIASLQFVQVITRYVFEAPMRGLEDILLYPVLWLYILGSVNASRENTQIRANVLEIFLKSEKAKKIQLIIADIATLLIGLWLVYWAWDFLQYSLRVQKESPTLYIPTIYADVALFIGLALMSVFDVVNIAKGLKDLKNTEAEAKNA